MPGPASYATPADMAAQLPEVINASDYTTLWTGLLSVASRAIDRYCDRYFYDEGAGTKYFDGDGTKYLFTSGHDFRTVTALVVVVTEGTSFSGNSAYTFTGDGVTPPSNFWCEPANPPYLGKAGDTNRRPFYYLVIPQNLNQGTGGWLPVFTEGKRTVSLTASWGWAAVPDEIFQIAVKLGIRMWKASMASYTGLVGDPEFGPRLELAKFLDANDLYTLDRYRRYDGMFL